MKLGIITSIFDGWTFEEMIDEVSRIGYETIEVASWPQGKAERRYAGVTHVDAERVLEDDAYAQHLLDYAAEHHVQIGALAYYPNNMDAAIDPSHFVWQMIDCDRAIRAFAPKIFHVHFKDIKLLRDRLAEYGTMAYPLDIMVPKIPGLGDVDWGAFVSALTEAGFDGDACVEVEDRAFESSRERVLASIEQSYRYMRQFVS